MILSVIAHYELVVGAERHVPGLNGLTAHYTDKQRGEARKLLERYADIKQKASHDIAELMEGKSK